MSEQNGEHGLPIATPPRHHLRPARAERGFDGGTGICEAQFKGYLTDPPLK